MRYVTRSEHERAGGRIERLAADIHRDITFEDVERFVLAVVNMGRGLAVLVDQDLDDTQDAVRSRRGGFAGGQVIDPHVGQ